MSIPREDARALLEELNATDVANFVAQAEAAKVTRTLEQATLEQQRLAVQTAELGARVEGLEARLQSAEAARQQAEQQAASLTRVLDQLAAGRRGKQA